MLKKIHFLSCANIPEMVLIRAHFNGLIKKIFLRGGEIKKLSKNSEETVYEMRIPHVRERGDDYIKGLWKSNEEIINESINSILLTLPPHDLGSLFSILLNKEINLPLSLVSLEWDKEAISVIGDPDIVLCDESEKYIFLIELKIQAKESNGKYSLQQHTKYSNLIQRLQSEGKIVEAALLAPSDNVMDSVVKKERDWFDYSDNKVIPLIENIDGKPAYVTNKSVCDYKSYLTYQLNEIERNKLDISPDKYFHLQYISFQQVKNALNEVAPHLVKPFSFIEQYSSM